jgi:hypothetical protein
MADLFQGTSNNYITPNFKPCAGSSGSSDDKFQFLDDGQIGIINGSNILSMIDFEAIKDITENIEVLEVIGSQIEELPVVASHQLAATVASIVLQLIDTHESELKGSVLTIDHLHASNLRHIPISIHPACGCSW